MKFSTSVLALVAVASTYARSITTPFLPSHSFLLKRELDINMEEMSKVSDECLEEYQNSEIMNECFPEMNLNVIKKVCTSFRSAKCLEVYSDWQKFIPSCKNDEIMKENFSDKFMDGYYGLMDMYCTFDEEGDLCPATIASFTGKYDNIRSTCQSKACTDKTIEFFSIINEEYDGIENSNLTTGSFGQDTKNGIPEVIAFFNSKECRDQHVTTTTVTATNDNSNTKDTKDTKDTDNSSDASSIKMGSALFMTLGLLLLSFY